MLRGGDPGVFDQKVPDALQAAFFVLLERVRDDLVADDGVGVKGEVLGPHHFEPLSDLEETWLLPLGGDAVQVDFPPDRLERFLQG